jgi:Flp pilus assembly pilin Flp
MQNLVEKFTPGVEATDDDGVVAIEYVLVAGLVALGVAITFGSSLWNAMLDKLNALFPAA